MFAVQKEEVYWPLHLWVLAKEAMVLACNTQVLPSHRVKFWKFALAVTQLAQLGVGTAEETDMLVLQIHNTNPKVAVVLQTSALPHMP
jgi:hypothetical protein